MSFDFRTICGVAPDCPTHRVASVLLPLGIVASLWVVIGSATLGAIMTGLIH